MFTWCACTVVGECCIFDQPWLPSWSVIQACLLTHPGLLYGWSPWRAHQLRTLKVNIVQSERLGLYIIYKPGKEFYIQYIEPTTSKGWRNNYKPFTSARCWLLMFLTFYRKARADMHTMAINHKAGWGESKYRPGWSNMKQPRVDQKCNTDLQLYKHGCVLRYKPCWRILVV